jgi:integrase
VERGYVVALTLGMRRGEVLGLRWSDIDRLPKIHPS